MREGHNLERLDFLPKGWLMKTLIIVWPLFQNSTLIGLGIFDRHIFRHSCRGDPTDKMKSHPI
jgi:hypothetical protein